MKKSILVFAVSVIILGIFVITCNTSSQKVENAKSKVKEANEDLDKANKEYLADIESYRKEAADKIAANDRSIAEFNARVANEKREVRASYKKKIEALEKKNSDLKKKMDEYKAEGKEKWKIFKVEFNHDLDEMGKAFKDFTVKNIH